MIARLWRGWAPLDRADEYQRHYEDEVSVHLTGVHGFRGARLLRRVEGDEVAFTSITFFTSMQAVRGFAGDHPNRAVVEDAAREALSHWDDEVTHHDVAVDL
ncbi:MAG: antibiotic biosynthesis monooxygenase [Actinophytocola sp.]|uniref:antibiotic biosynthesis monooxygenase family protein n=1 Tax=Actinophytocola sp. TaxID=1872138 RepID=UPI001328BF7D|nr:antibiotic biosynthesis monooxygenase [Actinophytocola sp.]MPZ79785.1 antibiotic biosynthesis monooxygenase [Actinophytocola sp.]